MSANFRVVFIQGETLLRRHMAHLVCWSSNPCMKHGWATDAEQLKWKSWSLRVQSGVGEELRVSSEVGRLGVAMVLSGPVKISNSLHLILHPCSWIMKSCILWGRGTSARVETLDMMGIWPWEQFNKKEDGTMLLLRIIVVLTVFKGWDQLTTQ